MRRIVTLVFTLVTILIGVVFALLNAEPVRVSYYFGATDMPLSLVIVISLAFGAGLGVLASVGLLVRTRREIARLRRDASLTAKEVMNLRTMPLKEQH
ncbi:MAG: hypothetical protein AMJ69_00850 [Gammaproteobacteria bacterium SG8_47]|nr:MAG: hypothetical protein AMJ69_00850 [Gammaproteobacteria bacterium SG8_47]